MILVIVKLTFISLTLPIYFFYWLFLIDIPIGFTFWFFLINITIFWHFSWLYLFLNSLCNYTVLIGNIVLFKILCQIYRVIKNWFYLPISYYCNLIPLVSFLFIKNCFYIGYVLLKIPHKSGFNWVCVSSFANKWKDFFTTLLKLLAYLKLLWCGSKMHS